MSQVVPALLNVLTDPHPKIRASVVSSLEMIGEIVENEEIKKRMKQV
jgi:hypothetical protein